MLGSWSRLAFSIVHLRAPFLMPQLWFGGTHLKPASLGTVSHLLWLQVQGCKSSTCSKGSHAARNWKSRRISLILTRRQQDGNYSKQNASLQKGSKNLTQSHVSSIFFLISIRSIHPLAGSSS